MLFAILNKDNYRTICEFLKADRINKHTAENTLRILCSNYAVSSRSSTNASSEKQSSSNEFGKFPKES